MSSSEPVAKRDAILAPIPKEYSQRMILSSGSQTNGKREYFQYRPTEALNSVFFFIFLFQLTIHRFLPFVIMTKALIIRIKV